MQGREAVNGGVVATQLVNWTGWGQMLVRGEDLKSILVPHVTPAHASGRKGISHQGVDVEIGIRRRQGRQRVGAIVQPVPDGPPNVPSAESVGQQKDVSAPETVQTANLLSDRGWQRRAFLYLSDFGTNSVTPDAETSKRFGDRLCDVGAHVEHVVARLLEGIWC